MKSTSSFKLLFATVVIALVFIGAGSAAGYDSQPSSYVQSIVLTPNTLMPGETGQLSITLVNPGTSPLSIYKMHITDTAGLTSAEYPALMNLGTIGAGKTLTVTFPITAKAIEGTF